MYLQSSDISLFQRPLRLLFEVFATMLNALLHPGKPVPEAPLVLLWSDGLHRLHHCGQQFLFTRKSSAAQLLLYPPIIIEVERRKVWRIRWVAGQADFPIAQKTDGSSCTVRGALSW